MRTLISISFLLFSSSLFACCATPFGEIAYEAIVERSKSKRADNGNYWLCDITFSKDKAIVGDAPGSFTSTLNGKCEDLYSKSGSYIVILFDDGKHDKNSYLLPKKKWGKTKWYIHNAVGVHHITSDKGQRVLQSIEKFGNLEWSGDFNYVYDHFFKSP